MILYRIKDLASGLYYRGHGISRWSKEGKFYKRKSDVKLTFTQGGLNYCWKDYSYDNLRIEIFETCPQGVRTIDDFLR